MNISSLSTVKKSSFAQKILIYPNEALISKSEPVKTIDKEVRALAERMVIMMKAAPGAGLAAPQLGVLQRVIVIDLSGGYEPGKNDIITMVNPHIIGTEGAILDEEGCLSLPNTYADIERPEKVRVEFLNLDGEREEIAASDRVARCIIHEIEHLDGTLFWDHLGRFKRNILKLKLKRLQKRRPVN